MLTRDELSRALDAGPQGWISLAKLSRLLQGKISKSTPYKCISHGRVRAKKSAVHSGIFVFAPDVTNILNEYINGRKAKSLHEYGIIPLEVNGNGYELTEYIENSDPTGNIATGSWYHQLLDAILLTLEDSAPTVELSDSIRQLASKRTTAGFELRLENLENAVNALSTLISSTAVEKSILESDRHIKILLIDAREYVAARPADRTATKDTRWLQILSGLDLDDFTRVYSLDREGIGMLSRLGKACLDHLQSQADVRIPTTKAYADYKKGDTLFSDYMSKVTAWMYAAQMRELNRGKLPVGHHAVERELLGLLPKII